MGSFSRLLGLFRAGITAMASYERLLTLFFRFHRGTRGSVTTISAFSFIVMLLAAGAAFDYQRWVQTQSRLQNALDAALLAAASSGEDNTKKLEPIVAAYLEANWATVYPDVKITYEIKITDNGRLAARARATVPTTIMALAGIKKMTADVKAQVARGGTVLELALVLDTTGSMASNNRMVELKKAANDLLQTLVKDGGEDVRIAVVPYSAYVNVGTTYRGQSWLKLGKEDKKNKWYGCVGSRDYPLDMTDDYGSTPIPGMMNFTCTNELVRLTDQLGPLVSAVESMHPNGYTYIPAGLIWGWRAISDELPFADGTPKGVKVRKKPVRKAIVLMTDGENTISPTYPAHDGKNTSLADKLTSTLCTNAKKDGIDIYTVAFEITGKTAKDVLLDCATKPSMFYDAGNADLLAEAFKSIGKDLTQLRIAE
jgi:Flp pilus assembly protein TadG